MEEGKIQFFNQDRGFGFIERKGENKLFVHISAFPPGTNKETLTPGTLIRFEVGPGNQGPQAIKAELINVPLDNEDDNQSAFHNPYTFVSTPGRGTIPKCSFAGDFNPLNHNLTHDKLHEDLWTGRIPIKLTVSTPLLLMGEDPAPNSQTHKAYSILDHLPESSLRGMLRSAYEIVTNSRYCCFRNSDRLAYRMAPKEALSLKPVILKNREDKLVAHICSTAKLPLYYGGENRDKNVECIENYVPKTGDAVWAEIYSQAKDAWKAVRIWSKERCPTQPETDNEKHKIVSGFVLITNENMSGKHNERIFFSRNDNEQVIPITDQLQKAWKTRIKNYREAHREDEIFFREKNSRRVAPWERIGHEPGKTAWSPFFYQDGRHKDRWGRTVHDAVFLKPGDMAYARCEVDAQGDTQIVDLFPVLISRELYDASPENLLDNSLKPASSLEALSPADRLFGWVRQEQGEGDAAYKGRLRVVCEDGRRSEIIKTFQEPIPLTILGQPKPAQGRFYVAADKNGAPQEGGYGKANYGYSRSKGLRGRKQYWHHRGLEWKEESEQAKAYWSELNKKWEQNHPNGPYQEFRRMGDEKDKQNRSIKGWIKPGTVFHATLHVQNAQPEEIGALLYLCSLSEGHYFRLGYGKPLGFGSVRMELDQERFKNGNLPLGTGQDWRMYYGDFSAAQPAGLGQAQQVEMIKKFKDSISEGYVPQKPDTSAEQRSGKRGVSSFADIATLDLATSDPATLIDPFDTLSFIEDFLQVLKGPKGEDWIHYPRSEKKPDPNGENFKWFEANERGTQLCLPAVTSPQGLPYNP